MSLEHAKMSLSLSPIVTFRNIISMMSHLHSPTACKQLKVKSVFKIALQWQAREFLINHKGPSSGRIISLFTGLLEDFERSGAGPILVVEALAQAAVPADAEVTPDVVEDERKEGADTTVTKLGLEPEALLDVWGHQGGADTKNTVVSVYNLVDGGRDIAARAVTGHSNRVENGRGAGRPWSRSRGRHHRRQDLLISEILVEKKRNYLDTPKGLTSAEADRVPSSSSSSGKVTPLRPILWKQERKSEDTASQIQSIESSMMSITSLVPAPARWSSSPVSVLADRLQTRKLKNQLESRNLSPSRHQMNPVVILDHSHQVHTMRRSGGQGGNKYGVITRSMMDGAASIGVARSEPGVAIITPSERPRSTFCKYKSAERSSSTKDSDVK